MQTRMKPALVLLMSALTLAAQHVHSQCFNQTLLSLCPSPLVLSPRATADVTVTCTGSGESLIRVQAVYLFIANAGGELMVARTMYNMEKPYFCSKRTDLEGSMTLSGSSTSIILRVENATENDLADEWKCAEDRVVGYHLIRVNETAFFDIIALATLTLPPMKTFDSSDQVKLICKVNSTRHGRADNVKATFQYEHQNRWVTIREDEQKQRLELAIPKGQFVLKVFMLPVQVFSFPARCRRYRCRLSYTDIFHVENGVRVTKHNCNLDQTASQKFMNNDKIHTQNNSVIEGKQNNTNSDGNTNNNNPDSNASKKTEQNNNPALRASVVMGVVLGSLAVACDWSFLYC